MTCVENSKLSTNGKLIGTKVAIADYNTIAGTSPTTSELLWLPGIGITTASSSVTCETIIIPKTAGIT